MNSRPSIKQWNNWHVILFHKQFKSNYWIEVSVHIQEFVLSTLILAATMSQCSNKPYSRMSISPRIRGMRSIFVISGQIFLKWVLALRAVSGNYPRLDTGDHLIETMFSKSSFGLTLTQNPNQLITITSARSSCAMCRI